MLFALARAAVGLFAYALPLVPLLALVPVPPSRPAPVPWAALTRAGRNRADLLALGARAGQRGRDAVLGRAAGVVLATVALFHLSRGEPGLEAGAYRLAGGLLGMRRRDPARRSVLAGGRVRAAAGGAGQRGHGDGRAPARLRRPVPDRSRRWRC